MTDPEQSRDTAPVIEPARSRVAEGSQERLLAERPSMMEALRQRLAAYLTREDDGGWLDFPVRRTRAGAETAAREVPSVPECAAWFRHITESGGLRHTEIRSACPALA
ncbi:hypothetical protein [Actinoplanes philippinensis]|uniref:hypothetical protein n=1 Tax=Actinoplanes philippinensis TaxID=35752 RepID=UPI0033F9D2A5